MSSQSDAFEAAREWVELVTELDALYVRQVEADAARPALPYITVDWPTDTNLNGSPHKRVGDPLDTESPYDHEYIQTERHDGTFRVEAFGPGALGTLNDLRPSLNHPEVRTILTAAGIEIRLLSPAALDTTELRNTTWEESAVVDFAVRYSHVDVGATAIIETATVNATVTDKGGGAPLDTTITASFA